VGAENTILVKLLVKAAVIASMASLLLRWAFAKRMLLRERRSLRQRVELGLLFGVAFAAGTLARLVLKYDAAEIGLEGAFVAGLVGGYVPGLIAGGMAALPAALLPSPHEWLAIPLLVGVGALGGVLRDIAPGPEEIWRFSPFFPFTISNWVLRLPSAESAFQMLLLFACVAIEFLRRSVADAFAHRGWLWAIAPEDGPPSAFALTAIYVSTVACIGLTLKVWNNTRNEWKLEEQRRLLMEARLRNLSSQINPHFLFNTLNSVAALTRGNPESAREVLVKLSTILRRLMRRQEAFAPLRDELRFIRDYLEIEQVRFGDKLRVHEEIDPAALDCLVPSMLLQPLVENSIKHGLGPKIEGGAIWLRGGRRGGRLQVEVEDDGVGVSGGAAVDALQSGIGIGNVHERLAVLFGADFQMTIENRVGGGTRVRVQIPQLDAPATDSAAAYEAASDEPADASASR
jgi:two-component system, LytTR family, sensor kinase